jgi:orotidine-5'-phosphate decarboxylase
MEQLLVALDVDTIDDARTLANTLRGWVGGFKIGSRLFTANGPAFVEELVGRGDRVFLDLKFHDIPNTVAGAVAAATRLGVWMVNVHAGGGLDMMRAARQAADQEAAKASVGPPLVIAVTVLTSFSQAGLAATGISSAVPDQVRRLALLAQEAGLDGVVASPQEIGLIREACDPRFAIVTPGIRGAADAKGDQTRTASASGALAAGATHIVVGRPIIAAADPRAAAQRIAEECSLQGR